MAQVTLLIARGNKTFAKRFVQTCGGMTKHNYDNVLMVDAAHLDCADLGAFFPILQDLEGQPDACLIRGKLIRGESAVNIRRLLHDRDFFDATIEDRESNLILMDIDDLRADPALTMAQRLALAVRRLPVAFHGADFVYQWSSSAGIDGWTTIKVHLWFWLDAPASSRHLRERAAAEGWEVDKSLFAPVQPHYTAAPILDGVDDPFAGKRSGYIRRSNRAVVLPAWAPAPPPPPRVAPIAIMVDADDPIYRARIAAWAKAIINAECSLIVDARDGAQNHQIYKSAFAIGRLVGAGLVAESDADYDLKTAAQLGRHPAGRAKDAIRSGLSAGKRKPRYNPDQRD